MLVTDLDEAAAQSVADEIAATGAQAAAHALDVADEGQWAEAVAAAARLFGPLTILIGNAALTSPAVMARDLGVLDLDMADWDRVIGVNLRGNLLVCRAVLPVMLEAGKGSITFTSSILGARAGRARAAYSVSKGGLDALVRSVATTYGSRGIRCNAVAPGFVATDAMRGAASPERVGALAKTSALGRLAAPEEIAVVIAFVASDRASYLTGQTLTVDGGVTAQLGI